MGIKNSKALFHFDNIPRLPPQLGNFLLGRPDGVKHWKGTLSHPCILVANVMTTLQRRPDGVKHWKGTLSHPCILVANVMVRIIIRLYGITDKQRAGKVVRRTLNNNRRRSSSRECMIKRTSRWSTHARHHSDMNSWQYEHYTQVMRESHTPHIHAHTTDVDS